MTARQKTAQKTAKPKSRRETRDDTAMKDAAVRAALPRVPFDGFTDSVLRESGAEADIPAADIPRLFPKGPLSLVEAFSDLVDREMERRLARDDLAKLKVRARISRAIKTRLDILRPHKEAARRAAAFLTLPPHAARASVLVYRTVDAMWRAAGDTATDFNFYTKRAILAGVYSATLLRWFTDDSEDEAATDAFLARRIDDVMRFEKLKSEMRERAKNFPSFGELLRPSAGRR